MFSPSIIVLYYTLLLLILHFRGRHSQLIWEIPASTYEHLDSSCNNVHFQNVKNKQLSSFGVFFLTQTIPDSIVPEVLEANIYRTPWILVGKPCEGFLKWGYPWVPPVIIYGYLLSFRLFMDFPRWVQRVLDRACAGWVRDVLPCGWVKIVLCGIIWDYQMIWDY